jgi:hypothetical protein
MELYKSHLLSDANLRAYYRMEAGALTTDSSGNSYTLTDNGVTPTAGIFGGGVAGTYLSIVNNLGITTGNQSHSFWVNFSAIPTPLDDTFTILSWKSGDTNDLFLLVQYICDAGTPKIMYRWSRINVAHDYNYYTVSLSTNTWHHFVIVKNSTGTKLQLYIDNVLVGNGTYTDGNGSGTTTALYLISGGEHWTIDDACVFNDVLTTSEINLLYTRTRPAALLNIAGNWKNN